VTERVVVVGAGIAGLAAAFRLQQAGAEVVVLEAADHVGGRMHTVERDGYRLDVAAAFLGGKYSHLRTLAAEAGVGDELIPTSDRLGFFADGGVHTVRSSHLTDLATTPVLSPRAKVSALKLLVDIVRVGKRLDYADLTRAADFDTESVLEYSRRRRLDHSLVHGFLDPVVRASLQNTLEQMSIVDLLFMLRNYLGATFMNFAGGINRLPEALARQVPVHLSAPVTSIEERAGGVAVTWTRPGEPEHVEEATACVIALSAQAMETLHPSLTAEQREIVRSLDYSQAVTVHVALDRIPETSAMYIQVPAQAHPDMLSIGVDHGKAPGRAPAGKGLLSSIWTAEWSAKHWNDADDEIVDAAVTGMETVFPGLGTDVVFGHVSRADPALLLSRAGTYQALRRFHRSSAPASRIALAGDYFGGNSTNAAACSGMQAAARCWLRR
jgi:protoporphyrinogen/coproporphyrinogen III oxidase